MNQALKRLIIYSASVAALTAAGLATAHPEMRGGDGYHGMGGHPFMQPRDDGQRTQWMQQRMAEYQRQLKEALKLTPAQESGWKALSDATNQRDEALRQFYNSLSPEQQKTFNQFRPTRGPQSRMNP